MKKQISFVSATAPTLSESPVLPASYEKKSTPRECSSDIYKEIIESATHSPSRKRKIHKKNICKVIPRDAYVGDRSTREGVKHMKHNHESKVKLTPTPPPRWIESEFMTHVQSGNVSSLRSLLDEKERPTGLVYDNKLLVNTRDSFGWTPLMIAAFAGHLTVVNILLSNGARTDTQNQANQSALDLVKISKLSPSRRTELMHTLMQLKSTANNSRRVRTSSVRQTDTMTSPYSIAKPNTQPASHITHFSTRRRCQDRTDTDNSSSTLYEKRNEDTSARTHHTYICTNSGRNSSSVEDTASHIQINQSSPPFSCRYENVDRHHANVDQKVVNTNDNADPEWCDLCGMTSSTGHQHSTAHLLNQQHAPFALHPLAHSVGYKLLRAQGWRDGEGLGVDGEGRKYPVAAVMKNDRRGIGGEHSKFKRTNLRDIYDEMNDKKVNAQYSGTFREHGSVVCASAQLPRALNKHTINRDKKREQRWESHLRQYMASEDDAPLIPTLT
eukprot:CFRG8147T1